MTELDMDEKSLFDIYYTDDREETIKKIDSVLRYRGHCCYIEELKSLREKIRDAGEEELRYISGLENRYL